MEIVLSILVISLIWMIYDLINSPVMDEEENIVPAKLHEETRTFLKDYKKARS